MTTLLESKARPFGSRKGAMLSVALHALLIGGAIVGTGRAMLPPREKVEEHPILYVATPPPPKVYVAPEPLPEVKKQPAPKTPRVAPRPAPPPPRRTPTPPAPTPRAAPVPQAVTAPIVAPIRVPTSVPAVDLKAIPTVSDVVASIPAPDPGKVVAAATGGGSRSSSDGDVDGGRSGGTKGGLGSGDAGRAYNENQVDRAVVVTRPASPRYPDALRSVSVTGEVMVQYIVDTRGRVERGSIRILSSTHKLFADAVRAALMEMRFRPAEAGGQPVRQLVEQPFVFKLDG